MSLLYTIDVGFNWNAPPTGSSFGEPASFGPLQWGLSSQAPGGSPSPAWVTQLVRGDQLRFQITDITTPAWANPENPPDTVQRVAGAEPSKGAEVRRYEPYRRVTEVAMVFGNPSQQETGEYPFHQKPAPVFEPEIGDSGLPGLVYSEGQIPFQDGSLHSPVYSAANRDWKLARWFVGLGAGGDVYEFDSLSFVEMGLRLTVEEVTGGPSRQFLFDPEFFVGATG